MLQVGIKLELIVFLHHFFSLGIVAVPIWHQAGGRQVATWAVRVIAAACTEGGAVSNTC
jgi:hypothetical protein